MDKRVYLTSNRIHIIFILLAVVCISQNIKAQDEQGLNDKIIVDSDFREKYSDLREYVKLENVTYDITREMFSKSDLPLLYELLNDEEYVPYWHNVAQIIGFLGDNQNSAQVLLDYFQRDDGTKNFSLHGKIWALTWIGKIGGKKADSVLKKALTEEGAKEVAKAWIEEQAWSEEYYQKNKDLVVLAIQRAAINGLVFSGTKENIDFITKLYNEQIEIALENKRNTDFVDNLAEAMGKIDYIAEHGIDGYLGKWRVEVITFIDPYVNKYNYRTITENLRKEKFSALFSEDSKSSKIDKEDYEYFMSVVNPPEIDMNIPEVSTSEPIYSGFLFYDGKYIEVPYILERRGMDLYVNDILLEQGPKSELYDYSVDTDPGEPPVGVSPFDPAPEGEDRRDNYYSKKWRYLYSHYDFETAKILIYEAYKKSTKLENVHWSGSSSISVLDKNIGREIPILLDLHSGGSALKQKTKEELYARIEDSKKHYEKRFRSNTISFEGKYVDLTGVKIDLLKALISDVNDSEKFRIIEEKRLLPGIRDEFSWMVTDFESSPQLKERVLLTRAGFSKEQIAERIKNSVEGFGTKPEEEQETSEVSR